MPRPVPTSRTKSGETASPGLVRLPLDLLELALRELERHTDEHFQPQVRMTLATLGARISGLAGKHSKKTHGEGDLSPAQNHDEICSAPAEVVTPDVQSTTAAEKGLGTNGDQQQPVEVVTPDGQTATTAEKGPGTCCDQEQKAGRMNDEDDELPVQRRDSIDLAHMFETLDIDGSGLVGAEELSTSLSRAGVTQREIREIMRTADTSGDGLIGRTEFINARHSQQLRAMRETLTMNDISSVGQPKHSCMLSQTSPVRVCWDLLGSCVLSYMAITEPLFLAFPSIARAEVFSSISVAIDVLFLSDLALNFRTGFCTADGFEVLEPRIVAKHYIKTWFVVDLVSSVPVDAMMEGFANLQPLRLLKYGKVVRVIKLLRASSALTVASRSDLAMDIIDYLRKAKAFRYFPLLYLSLTTLLICHWLACLMIASGDGFLRDYQDVSSELRSEYISALYWGFTTVTTVGYGDITPGSDRERLFAIGAMIVGGAFYGYSVATFTNILTGLEVSKQVYQNKMLEVETWLDYHQFPRSLQRRVRRYFERYLTVSSPMDDETMLKGLSPDLRNEVGELLVSPAVRQNPVFSGLPAGVMPRMAKILHHVEAEESEIIVRHGEVGDAMYIIIAGEVQLKAAAVDTERQGLGSSAVPEVLHLGVFDSFGVELFASPATPYNYTAMAQTRVIMETLSVAAFYQEFQAFPYVCQTVRDNSLSYGTAEKRFVDKSKPFELEALQLLRELHSRTA